MLTTESRGLVDRGAAYAAGRTGDQIVSGKKRTVRRHKQAAIESLRYTSEYEVPFSEEEWAGHMAS